MTNRQESLFRFSGPVNNYKCHYLTSDTLPVDETHHLLVDSPRLGRGLTSKTSSSALLEPGDSVANQLCKKETNQKMYPVSSFQFELVCNDFLPSRPLKYFSQFSIFVCSCEDIIMNIDQKKNSHTGTNCCVFICILLFSTFILHFLFLTACSDTFLASGINTSLFSFSFISSIFLSRARP